MACHYGIPLYTARVYYYEGVASRLKGVPNEGRDVLERKQRAICVSGVSALLQY